MGCSHTIARIFLFVINIIFFLLGLALLVVGCLVRFGSTIVSEHIRPLLSKVGSGAAGDVDLNTLFNGVAIAFIILGAVVFVIGFLGCCGAMCKYKILILLYGILVLLVIIGEIVCVALAAAMTDKFEANLKSVLTKSIETDYEGSNMTTAVSGAWNYIFVELDCCGVDDYEDLHKATKWPRNVTYSGSTYTLVAPLACCKGITGALPNYKLPSDPKCAYAPTDSTSNYKTGCYDAVKTLFQKHSTIVIAVGVSIVVVEIVCMVAAFCLYSAWKKEGVI